MRPNIFEYTSYRGYLKDRLEHLGRRSGLKRQAAAALRVHTTFISQVVLGKADLSLDQGEGINLFLAHSEEESEFFLDLLIFERAGNERLKKRFEAKIKQRQTDRAQIKKRLEKSKEIDENDQATFYSSHLYGLLHILASIPKFQKRERMIEAVGFPPEITNGAIDFLLGIGVLKKSKDQIVPGEQHVHLGRDSKFVRQHHTNWRTATIQSLSFALPSDLHYSMVFSCSEADSVKIRESLLAHLKTLTKQITESKEESVFVYCFDFFRWAP